MKTTGYRNRMMLLLAMTLSAGTVLGACSNSQPEAAKETETPAATEGEKTAETPAPEPEKRGKISALILDRGAIDPSEGTYAENRWTKWINENAGVDVEFVPVPRAESINKVNVLLASGQAPDVIAEYDANWLKGLAEQKQALALDELIEQHSVEYKALLEKYPELRQLGTMPDGKLYLVGSVAPRELVYGIFIRQDWLEKLGLEVPKTVEEFYNVAHAFAHKDPDGNGQKDTFGVNLSYEGAGQIDAMYGNEMMILQDDKIVRQFDRMKAANEMKQRLFANDVVDKDYLNDKNGAKAEQDFVNGKLGIYLGKRQTVDKSYNTLKGNVPEAKIVPILYPESEFGAFGPDFNPQFTVNTIINAKTKDPIAAIKYIDFLAKQSTAEALQYGLPGEHVNMVDGCPVAIDAEKNKKEVYAGEYGISKNKIFLKDCKANSRILTSEDPLDKEFIEIWKQTEAMYFDPSRMKAGFTNSRLRPAMPEDISTTFNNGWNDMNNFFAKAIVGGGTIEAAYEETMNAWNNGGGPDVEKWLNDWYAANKDKWIFMDDLYAVK